MAQRAAVAQFESALQDLKTPPKYAPPPSAPLAFLQQQQATAANEQERRSRLKQAEAALAHSREVLAEMEARWAEVEAQATAAWGELHEAAAKVNRLSEQLRAAGDELEAIAAKHRDVIFEQRGDRERGLLWGTAALHTLPFVEVLEGDRLRISQSGYIATGGPFG